MLARFICRWHGWPPYLTVVSIDCIGTRRKELTRQAARLFAQKGYHGTSMGDLAAAMGVQKGSLYSLTESKQGLLYETMREGAAAGELVAPEPRLAAVFILSAMNAVAHWYRPDGPLGPDALAAHYADLFLTGLQAHREETP